MLYSILLHYKQLKDEYLSACPNSYFYLYSSSDTSLLFQKKFEQRYFRN